MSIKEGILAPDFTLPSTSGKDFNLRNEFKNQRCVIYFYPKDNTPGCTKEACHFRDTIETFKKIELPIVGISCDDIESHMKFKEQYKLPFELLYDKDGEVCKAYDSYNSDRNEPKRRSFLLDENHKIVYICDSKAVDQVPDILQKMVKLGYINENDYEKSKL